MMRVRGAAILQLRKVFRMVSAAVLLVTATACGGGGGGGSGFTAVAYTAGVYEPSSNFAAKCASPRAGTSDKKGSVTQENFWLRSWTNELYLWYNEVPDVNPATYTTASAYFDILKTSQKTASGADKDKFHFTYDTAAWEALSQSGVQAGYGADFLVLASTPPRRVVISLVEPVNSAPANAPGVNLSRGEEVISIDNVDLVNATDQASVDVLNAGLSPKVGEQHTFGIRELNGTTRVVTMTAANVTLTPVQNAGVIAGTTVGYMLFNDHVATSESLLINAINTLQASGVTDLVLDIRYNGGGYLAIASELAYMIAGPQRTSGKTFETTQFNDKNPTVDPVTKETITPTPFLSSSQFSTSSGQALPTLNFGRVYVLTSANTCSASESIINSLDGIGVQVIQIGSTTCGKPYGFYPQDNCGTTYFSIEFRGVNDVGYGDYTDGFQPPNAAVVGSKTLAGCAVADDFTHALGSTAEARLAAALNYRQNGSCPSPATGLAKPSAEQSLTQTDGVLIRTPVRENRILTPYTP